MLSYHTRIPSSQTMLLSTRRPSWGLLRKWYGTLWLERYGSSQSQVTNNPREKRTGDQQNPKPTITGCRRSGDIPCLNQLTVKIINISISYYADTAHTPYDEVERLCEQYGILFDIAHDSSLPKEGSGVDITTRLWTSGRRWLRPRKMLDIL